MQHCLTYVSDDSKAENLQEEFTLSQYITCPMPHYTDTHEIHIQILISLQMSALYTPQ